MQACRMGLLDSKFNLHMQVPCLSKHASSPMTAAVSCCKAMMTSLPQAPAQQDQVMCCCCCRHGWHGAAVLIATAH